MNQITQNLEDKISEQQAILEQIKELEKDRNFYRRLLIQAVLTGNGKVDIDPSKAQEAFSLLDSVELEFGNGKVCFHKEKHSLFFQS